MKKFILKTIVLLLGVFVGCLLVILLGQTLLATRRTLVLPPPTPIVTPRDFTQSSGMDVSGYGSRDILTIAFSEDMTGNSKDARDMILQNMNLMTSPEDQSLAYQILASAETHLGHPERALPYAEKSVGLEVRENNLLVLAQSYEYNKDLDKALATYQRLLELNNADSKINREFLIARVNTLSQILGTPVP